jgi:hypothetical protein
MGPGRTAGAVQTWCRVLVGLQVVQCPQDMGSQQGSRASDEVCFPCVRALNRRLCRRTVTHASNLLGQSSFPRCSMCEVAQSVPTGPAVSAASLEDVAGCTLSRRRHSPIGAGTHQGRPLLVPQAAAAGAVAGPICWRHDLQLVHRACHCVAAAAGGRGIISTCDGALIQVHLLWGPSRLSRHLHAAHSTAGEAATAACRACRPWTHQHVVANVAEGDGGAGSPGLDAGALPLHAAAGDGGSDAGPTLEQVAAAVGCCCCCAAGLIIKLTPAAR